MLGLKLNYVSKKGPQVTATHIKIVGISIYHTAA